MSEVVVASEDFDGKLFKNASHFLKFLTSQIHPALQQISAHSTLELCLCLVGSRKGFLI